MPLPSCCPRCRPVARFARGRVAAPAAASAASRRSSAWRRPPASYLPRPAPRHRRVRRTPHRAPSPRAVRRPRRPSCSDGDVGRCDGCTAGPGSAAASAIGASDSIAAPTRRARCRSPRQNDSVADGQALLDPAGVSPSSRPMSAGDRAARWVSSSTLRCWSGRWCSASSTDFCSALMPLSRGATAGRRAGAGPSPRRADAPTPPGRAAGPPCASAAGPRRTRPRQRSGPPPGHRSVRRRTAPTGVGWQVEVVEVGDATRVVPVRKRGHTGPRLPACLTGLPGFLGQDGGAMTDLLSRPSDTSTSTRPPTSRLGRVLDALRGRPPGARTATRSRAGRSRSRPRSPRLAAAATMMVMLHGGRRDRLVPRRRRRPRPDHRRAAGRRRRLAGRQRLGAQRPRRTPRDRAAHPDRADRRRASTAGAAGPPRRRRRSTTTARSAWRPPSSPALYVVVAVVTCVVVGQEDSRTRPGPRDHRLAARRRRRGHARHGRRHRTSRTSPSSGCRAGCARWRTAPPRPSCCWSSPRRSSWP